MFFFFFTPAPVFFNYDLVNYLIGSDSYYCLHHQFEWQVQDSWRKIYTYIYIAIIEYDNSELIESPLSSSHFCYLFKLIIHTISLLLYFPKQVNVIIYTLTRLSRLAKIKWNIPYASPRWSDHPCAAITYIDLNSMLRWLVIIIENLI